ncbi:hypothetical protein TeGR_g3539, partial [Tetraparma gracilis]
MPPPTAADVARASNTVDVSSLSNPSECRPTHLDLDVAISFEEQTIRGTAAYQVEVLSGKATYVALDCKDLDVFGCEVNGSPARHSLHDVEGMAPAIFGQQLRIELPPATRGGGGLTLTVSVRYATRPSSSALQWLPPSQTLGKKRPYLFSQCQAIHARTLLPCMDAPAAKVTYAAEVAAAGWATVLMSALSKGSAPGRHPDGTPDGTTVHKWDQPVPTSPYLIAFCVGDLASRDVSPRCRVWAEPALVEQVAYEFSETEAFLATAEALTLPYQWGRYDLVCLPPSFPYGGMENPCLTFVTPTLLAGDRSLADVVAHEIAHSWTGNLVTNATWEHFWLNEGWTMWLQ